MQNPQVSLRKIYPVVVGINRYLHHERIKDLEFAVRDAQRMTSFLRGANAAFESVSFEPLFDAEATAERVRDELRKSWNSMRVGLGDVLLFYFAGHGDIFRAKAYLFCYDTNPADPNSGGLRLDDLYQDMQYVHANSVIVILDACRSGAIIDPGTINQNTAQQMRILFSRNPLLTQGNSIIFPAAHADQKARENPFIKMPDGEGGGVFTCTLLRGWQYGEACNIDGDVTPQSLADYLLREFKALPDQQPIPAVTGGTPLVLGRFAPRPIGQPIPVPAPAPPSSGLINITIVRTPTTPSQPAKRERKGSGRALAITAAAGLALAVLLGVLVIVSPFFFALAFALACIVSLISIPIAGRGAVLALLIALAQAVLLVGVAQTHFGLLRGFGPVAAIARLEWVALVIFAIQALFILYRTTEELTSS